METDGDEAEPHFLSVGRLEAAKRQMVTAALIFFREEDTVSFYTLVAAAYGLVRGISKNTGSQAVSVFDGGKRGSKTEININFVYFYAANRFKHADDLADPDAVPYSPALAEMVLFYCCLDAVGLGMKLGPALTAYIDWYIRKFPERLGDDEARAQYLQGQPDETPNDRRSFLACHLAMREISDPSISD